MEKTHENMHVIVYFLPTFSPITMYIVVDKFPASELSLFCAGIRLLTLGGASTSALTRPPKISRDPATLTVTVVSPTPVMSHTVGGARPP